MVTSYMDTGLSKKVIDVDKIIVNNDKHCAILKSQVNKILIIEIITVYDD